MKAAKNNYIAIAVLVICCLFFLLLSFVTYKRIDKMASAAMAGYVDTVVIDAGHGGEDGGASSKGGVPEKNINLAIAKDLQSLLEVSGYKVVMTRDADVSIADDNIDTIKGRKTSDMHNRLKILESQGSCVFVSIHQNFFTQSRYCGAQVFYSKNNENSKVLADIIADEIKGLIQPDNERKSKPATSSIFLLWHAKVPAVLVECGFLSNEAEAAKLNNTEYQQQMAFAIYCGLMGYLASGN